MTAYFRGMKINHSEFILKLTSQYLLQTSQETLHNPRHPSITLTPLDNKDASAAKSTCTRRFRAVCVTIEEFIEVPKTSFRCLLRPRALHYGPTAAGEIVNACAARNNMCHTYGYMPEDNNPADPKKPEQS